MKPNDTVEAKDRVARLVLSLKLGTWQEYIEKEGTLFFEEALTLAIRSLGGLDRVKMKYILNGRNSLGIPLNEQGTEAIAQALITAYNKGELWKK